MTSKALILAALMAAAAPAAAETAVYLGAWSTHLGLEGDYNETHNLVAVDVSGVMAGYFKNSYGRDTVFVGYKVSQAFGDFEAGIMVGAMRGYTDCVDGFTRGADTKVCPMAVPSVSYTAHRVQPTLMLLGNALAFSVRVQL